MRFYYFGCLNGPGHFLWTSENASYPRNHREELCPWGRKIDGLLTREHGQGVAEMHQTQGWTAITMQDRSVDRRPGSNAAFIAEGEHGFDEMVSLALEHFPRVCARIGPISQVPAFQPPVAGGCPVIEYQTGEEGRRCIRSSYKLICQTCGGRREEDRLHGGWMSCLRCGDARPAVASIRLDTVSAPPLWDLGPP